MIHPAWQHRLTVEAQEWTRYYGPLRVSYRIDDKWHWDLLTIVLLTLWICGSTYLMFHIWRAHPQDGVLKKLIWTIILVVPILGWLLYGQFYGESRDEEAGQAGNG